MLQKNTFVLFKGVFSRIILLELGDSFYIRLSIRKIRQALLQFS